MELKIKINSGKGEKTTEEDLDKAVEYLFPFMTYADQEQFFKWKGVKFYPDGVKVVMKNVE